MAHYFASDVHLRDDQPERDKRFRRFLDVLEPADSLVIAGDLCDFWMGARKSARRLAEYPSLRALVEFRRAGGSLAILPGNHDHWLQPFYRDTLGATLMQEPVDLIVEGLRLRLVHGHLLGARRLWKAGMESHAFFRAFGLLPGPFARPLDRVLTWKNERGLLADEERHLAVYRTYAASCRDVADLVVIGHVHRAVDEVASRSHPRLVVLGGWQYRSSYLRIDEAGAAFRVIPDGPATAEQAAADTPATGLSAASGSGTNARTTPLAAACGPPHTTLDDPR
ncbi:MAG: UDP-2,3-diacylglucosamine diphosphatase [Isosphaeraceae bacterium]